MPRSSSLRCGQTMISVDQALDIIHRKVTALPGESVPLERAQSRVLAEKVVADIDLPPFDRARMDGYAVRSPDVSTAPVALHLIGEIPAGATFHGALGPGQAVKIFTGAPMPAGADAVQKIEVTEASSETVTIRESVVRGQFVTPRASEVAAGQIIAEPGREIGAPEMAVLASFGYSNIKVGQRPRVAVLSTGSELVPVSQRPEGAEIRNSNSYTIGAYARRDGAEADVRGIVKDTPEATHEALVAAARHHHIVITTGGVSMGDYDLVKAALSGMGAEVFFDKVSIRPGKPTVFARLGETYFFGLPGNPVSTSVTYNVFVRTAIRKMLGDSGPYPSIVRAFTSHSIKDASSRRSFLPARFYVDAGRAMVEPLKWGGSSDLVAFMGANALIIVPEATHAVGEGEMVDAMFLTQL